MGPKPGYHYEVNFHGQIELPDGSITGDHGGKPTSWCVYVREYKHADDDTWDVIEEYDFDTYGEASSRAEVLSVKYDCGIDEF